MCGDFDIGAIGAVPVFNPELLTLIMQPGMMARYVGVVIQADIAAVVAANGDDPGVAFDMTITLCGAASH